MDMYLIKQLYDLHVNGFEKAFCKVINDSNFDIVYSNSISDYYDNFISNFNINSKKEFYDIINVANNRLKKIGKKTTIYLFPFMNKCYDNRDYYFIKDEFELISKEVWQVFKDFENMDKIKTNCIFDVELELAKNMKQYGNFMYECFKTEDDDDPYGSIDDGYAKEYANFKSPSNNIECNAYYVKVNGKKVGVTTSVNNKEYYGIYGLAIKKEFRNQGIGKEVLLKHLYNCKNKKIKLAFLQTEYGYYPYKMYKNIGFEDLFNAYYYLKNK